jgi:hypothetical protein
MDKNWLIRTKNNHILGPISKEKVLELYHNGSVKAEDEICSGNGYWFFVREKELVEKYLLGDALQSFNPVSEADDRILDAPEDPNNPNTQVIDLNEVELEAEPALEVTESEDSEKKNLTEEQPQEEEVLQEEIQVHEEQKEEVSEVEPQQTEQSEKERNEQSEEAEAFALKDDEALKAELESNPNIQVVELNKQKSFGDYFLVLISLGLLALAVMAFYFRKNIMQHFLSSAHAQTEVSNSLVKKKV